MSKTCYGCMREKNASPICEHCGFDERRKNERHQLPIGIVLRQQYVVGRVLGQGGFGITYIGWDMNLDMPVAIKEFYPGNLVSRDCTMQTEVRCYTNARSAYEDSKARFLREAKALAKFMDVPEIVRVQSFFEENGTAYIVMEYVQGTDLRNYLRSREDSPSAGEILEMVRPLMQALTVVHEAGLVHRDISPDNIMLLPSGQVKLLDFGAVREVEHAGVDRELTRSTQAILKHGFAPLEQYQAKGALGPWTDVYALCATLYYCMTGRVPPEAHDRMLDNAQLEWNRIEGLTKRQIETLEKGMALLPKDRLGTVKELYDGLYAVEAEENIHKTEPAAVTVDEEKNTEADVQKENEPDRNSTRRENCWKRPVLRAAAVILPLVLIKCILVMADFYYMQEDFCRSVMAASLHVFPVLAGMALVSLVIKKTGQWNRIFSDLVMCYALFIWLAVSILNNPYYGNAYQICFMLFAAQGCTVALMALRGDPERIRESRKTRSLVALCVTVFVMAAAFDAYTDSVFWGLKNVFPIPLILAVNLILVLMHLLEACGRFGNGKVTKWIWKGQWVVIALSCYYTHQYLRSEAPYYLLNWFR